MPNVTNKSTRAIDTVLAELTVAETRVNDLRIEAGQLAPHGWVLIWETASEKGEQPLVVPVRFNASITVSDPNDPEIRYKIEALSEGPDWHGCYARIDRCDGIHVPVRVYLMRTSTPSRTIYGFFRHKYEALEACAREGKNLRELYKSLARRGQ